MVISSQGFRNSRFGHHDEGNAIRQRPRLVFPALLQRKSSPEKSRLGFNEPDVRIPAQPFDERCAATTLAGAVHSVRDLCQNPGRRHNFVHLCGRDYLHRPTVRSIPYAQHRQEKVRIRKPPSHRCRRPLR